MGKRVDVGTATNGVCHKGSILVQLISEASMAFKVRSEEERGSKHSLGRVGEKHSSRGNSTWMSDPGKA